MDNPSPTPIAVALTYDEERPPFLSAKGRGLIAEEILRIARENNIVVHEDPTLVETLALLELGQQIPESLFKAIAEVIAFAYSLREDNPLTGLENIDRLGKQHGDE
ncbi:MAG TPA: EscU/YscU/HrcU family type III secretion system export apparatus switch protein [Motiliproteus sp.]